MAAALFLGAKLFAGTTLADIEKDPKAYEGKIVEIDGWGWGWMAHMPETLRGCRLRHAKGNTGSKNDGTFSDGNLTILYPVPLRFSGKMHLKAEVSISKFGWRMKPISVSKRD